MQSLPLIKTLHLDFVRMFESSAKDGIPKDTIIHASWEESPLHRVEKNLAQEKWKYNDASHS
jgi:hypothetical protein